MRPQITADVWKPAVDVFFALLVVGGKGLKLANLGSTTGRFWQTFISSLIQPTDHIGI